jgi:uroporphyrinogen decarboxylase
VEKDIGNVSNRLLPEPDISALVMPNADDPKRYVHINKKISAGPDLFRMFRIGFSLYERAWTMRGMEDLMMDLILNPGFVHELLGTIADFNIAAVRNAAKHDIDAVYFGDDWGQQSGLQMGYKHWKEFIYPQLKRMYGAVREAGLKVVIHSCGDVDELFDDLVDIGLNCFNPFQPEVMDVKALHAKYHGRLAFWGGLSTQRTLPHGSVDDVIRETSQLIEMGRKGGYIFSPAHAVEGDVPPENIVAMIDTLKAQPGHKSVSV